MDQDHNSLDLEEQKVIDIGVKKSISSTPTKYMHVMAHGQDGATSASIWARKNPGRYNKMFRSTTPCTSVNVCLWLSNSLFESKLAK